MQLIEEIHNSPMQFVLAISGGGSDAVSNLLQIPGASRTLLEAAIPYSAAAMTRFLGAAPDSLCSSETARAMAMASYLRATELSPDADPALLAGISCTAALTTDRKRRGNNRIHIGMQTSNSTHALSVQLDKNSRTRLEEESIACNMLLNAMASISGVSQSLAVDLTRTESVIQEKVIGNDDMQALFAGRLDCFRATPGTQAPDTVKTLFPGAFNPFHPGHDKIACIAAEITGQEAHLEICAVNVDKLPLDYIEMERRVQLLEKTYPVWFTRAPTFIEKSSIFPGVTFAVGIDTIIRIADRRYYQNDDTQCKAAIDSIRGQDCRFLVFGREVAGTFVSLAQVELPQRLREICKEVPESIFRVNISSTKLREAQRSS